MTLIVDLLYPNMGHYYFYFLSISVLHNENKIGVVLCSLICLLCGAVMGRRKNNTLVETQCEVAVLEDTITGDSEIVKLTRSLKLNDLPSTSKIKQFTMLFQYENRMLHKDLNGIELRLLFYLLCSVGYGNIVESPMSEISKDTGYAERTVYKAMRTLEEMNIIIRVTNSRDKRIKTIALNPVQSWKGNMSDRAYMLKSMKSSQKTIISAKAKDNKLKPNTEF